jgi:hypothetical protein
MNDKSLPAFSIAYNMFAIPYNFLIGFVVGIAAPVATIGAIVAGIRLVTGKVPYPFLVEDEEERHLALRLVDPAAVEGIFAEQKEQIGGELIQMQTEIRSIIEETKAKAVEAAEEAEATE